MHVVNPSVCSGASGLLKHARRTCTLKDHWPGTLREIFVYPCCCTSSVRSCTGAPTSSVIRTVVSSHLYFISNQNKSTPVCLIVRQLCVVYPWPRKSHGSHHTNFQRIIFLVDFFIWWQILKIVLLKIRQFFINLEENKGSCLTRYFLAFGVISSLLNTYLWNVCGCPSWLCARCCWSCSNV